MSWWKIAIVKFWPPLLFFLWSVFFFRSVLFENKIFLDADIGHQYLPWYVFTAEKVRNWEIPLWSSNMQAGFPLFAGGETGALYPPLQLLFYLLPVTTAFNFIYPLHFFLLCIFCYMFQRNIGCSRLASFIGAFSFAYGLFFVTKIIHVSFLMSATWMPAGFYFLHKGILETRKYLLFLPVIIVLQLFAGHPQAAFVSLIGYIVYFVLLILFYFPRKSWKDRCKTTILFSSLIFTGLCLAGIQLLPLVELSRLTARSQSDLNFLFSYSFPISHIVTLLLPDFFGRITPRTFDGTAWYGGAYWEFALYMGLIPLLMAFLNVFFLKRDRITRVFIIFFTLFLLLAIGGYLQPYRILVRVLTLFVPLPFRASSRFLLVATFALSSLCAIGINHFFERFGKKQMKVHVVKVAFVFLAIFDLYHYGYTYNTTYERSVVLSLPDSVKSWPVEEIRNTRIFTEARFPPFVQAKNSLQPNLNLLWQIDSIAITSPLHLAHYDEILTKQNFKTVLPRLGVVHRFSLDNIDEERLVEETDGVYDYILNNSLPKIFATDEYIYMPSTDKAVQFLTDQAHRQNVVALNITPDFVSASTPLQSQMQIITRSDERVLFNITLNKKAVAVYLDNYYPGWQVWVDGMEREVLRVNGLFKGVMVEEGNHSVIFQFRPRSILWGLMVSAFGVFAYLFAIVLLLFFKKDTKMK